MSQSPEAMKVWNDAVAANLATSDGVWDEPAQASASVIEAALQKARDEEIAAVVAWLRSSVEGMTGRPGAYIKGGVLEFSDFIARGEHRRQG